MSYFSGQGKLFVAELTNGLPGPFRWVGNVPDFKPTFETSKLEHKESFSGQRLLDKTITTEVKAKVSATLEDWSAPNLALAVRAESASVAAGSVTNELLPIGLVAGDIVALKKQKVSAVVVQDSTGVPLTLVAGTDYRILDADFGTIEILDPTGFVQPFNVDYANALTNSSAFFSIGAKEVAIRFEGVNTADNNAKVLAEIYRVALDPTKELGLITNDLGQFVLEGNALVDPTKLANDPVFGQFGRILFL